MTSLLRVYVPSFLALLRFCLSLSLPDITLTQRSWWW